MKLSSGRYRIERNERLCIYWENRQIDDEYHFICECPIFNNLRGMYINPYYRIRPNVYKLCQLLSTQNNTDIIKIGKYIKEAFQIRIRLDG